MHEEAASEPVRRDPAGASQSLSPDRVYLVLQGRAPAANGHAVGEGEPFSHPLEGSELARSRDPDSWCPFAPLASLLCGKLHDFSSSNPIRRHANIHPASFVNRVICHHAAGG